MGEGPVGPSGVRHRISFRDALPVWARIAAYSFGGPAGQIAVMQRILVDEKRWFSPSRFLHALNYCMLLPGPEAQQLATYGGWLLHGWRGGLVAGGLFILPGFVSILALSVLYAGFRDLGVVQALFYGLKPAVLAVVVEAVIRIGGRALKNAAMATIAAAAFVAIFVYDVPFPAIIAGAAAVGYAGGKLWEHRFVVIRKPESPGDAPGTGRAEAAIPDDVPSAARPTWRGALRTAAVWLSLWWIPVAFLALLLGPSHVLTTEAVFFSKAAVVTFGGAYAVLAYIAQQAVETYGWLAPGEMLDGLGLAETTPGPLIQVVQFVGFLGAYRHPGGLDPTLAGILGSVVTTWVTFTPSFLWIFVGAPFMERLRRRASLGVALSAITAAVVGVILNLALWFAINTLFGEARTVTDFGMELLVPTWGTVDPAGLGIAALAFYALFRLRWGMLRTLGGGALLGTAWFLVSG